MAATGLLGVNPYYKGVKLDVSKPVNLAIQLEQKERAKQEALDKYFMDYEKSLNSAGMRQQDQDVFLRKLANNKDYYFKNREKILNPSKYGAEAQSQYMAGFKDILSDINKSKQLAANGKVLSTAVIDARKNNRTIPKEVTDAIFNNELSMSDPRFQAFDPVNFDAYDKNDATKYANSIYSKIKLSESKPERIYDPEFKEISYKTVNDISNKSFGQIESLVASELQRNRGLVDDVKAFARDENELNRIGKLYQDFSGKKMNPNSLQDVATAYTISLKPEAKVTYTTPRQDAEFRRLQAMEDAKEMARYRKEIGADEDGADSVDEYLTNANSSVTFGGQEGKDVVRLTLPSKVTDDFKEGKRDIPVIGRGLTGGTFYNIKFQDPKLTGGQTDVIDWGKTKPIPEDQMRAAVVKHVFPSGTKVKLIRKKTKPGEIKFN
jgi:hypothetical protein